MMSRKPLIVAAFAAAAALSSAPQAAGASSELFSTQLAYNTAMEEKSDIVDTAMEAGTFSTLVAAVKAAGLVETLKGDGPFTVFAPTDDAFAALPAGTVEALLKPENKGKLQAILTYHVVPGKVMSQDIAGKRLQADTVNGAKLPVDATKGVMVGTAAVVMADVETSNGVIHAIDTVLMPGG